MSGLHEVMAATLALSGMLPSFPRGRRRRPNQRPDGTWIMGARETARLAWRSRVDAAARAWHRSREHLLSLVRGPEWDRVLNEGPEATRFDDAVKLRDASWDAKASALSSPKPWRSGRRPDPRNHYSRRHRRACRMCRPIRQWLRMTAYVTAINHADPYVGRFHRFTRDPHGRSDR